MLSLDEQIKTQIEIEEYNESTINKALSLIGIHISYEQFHKICFSRTRYKHEINKTKIFLEASTLAEAYKCKETKKLTNVQEINEQISDLLIDRDPSEKRKDEIIKKKALELNSIIEVYYNDELDYWRNFKIRTILEEEEIADYE